MVSAAIAIIGAGLAGCCAALELSRRGHGVVILEQDAVPMNRASLRNEGKVHLGLIYANDPTLATARLQLRAALRFRPLLERWIGDRVQRVGVSTPFDYLVAQDSLLGPAQLGEFYAKVDAMYRAEIEADASLDYLGLRPDRLACALGPGEVPAVFAGDLMQGAFRTQERAIDTDDLAAQVREAVEAQAVAGNAVAGNAVAGNAVAGGGGIELLTGHQVSGVERAGDEYVITGRVRSETLRVRAAQVINASWERRMGIDQTMGIVPRPGMLHRLKYRVICRTPAALEGCPSITIVIGRYGDVVVRPNGTVYLSWYPAGLQGWAPGVEPPREWDAACRGEPASDVAARVADATVAALAQWVPALEGAEVLRVDAGAIVADGQTDVDDAASGLHARVNSGVLSLGGYHSVDPGKLTSAPMYAVEVAERVDRALRGGASA